jgi:hypothetical protein
VKPSTDLVRCEYSHLFHMSNHLRKCATDPQVCSSSMRMVGARGCGFESGIKRRVRQQLTESAGHRVHRRERRWPRGAVTKAAPEEELNAGLPSSTRVAIENWAKQQKDRPSRSEAIHRSRLAGARCYALLLLEPLVVGLGPNVYNIMRRYTRHGIGPCAPISKSMMSS